MLTSLTVRNFRCFRDLTVEPLDRINLIAGKNNAGKTALLEALWLNLQDGADLGTPVWRGDTRHVLDAEDLWTSLALASNEGQPIEITVAAQPDVRHTLRIHWSSSKAARSKPVNWSGAPNAGNVWEPAPEVDVECTIEHGATGRSSVQSVVYVGPGEVRSALMKDRHPWPCAFVPPASGLTLEDAWRFSKLVEVRHEGELLPALRVLEPRLRGLALLVKGGRPVIAGDIGVGRLLPLGFMGEGIARFASFVLAVLRTRNGTVLIDEVENGLHHSVLKDVWSALGEAARQSGVQVFATTHSWECIVAAHQAFSESGTYDFRLHRLDRLNGDVRAVSYDQEMLETATTVGLEVR